VFFFHICVLRAGVEPEVQDSRDHAAWIRVAGACSQNTAVRKINQLRPHRVPGTSRVILWFWYSIAGGQVRNYEGPDAKTARDLDKAMELAVLGDTDALEDAVDKIYRQVSAQ
jgi:hypothetical protein